MADGVTKHERLSLNLGAMQLTKTDAGRTYAATLITEGVFQPGIGNPQGHRIHFSAAMLEKMAPSGEGKHVDLDHDTKDIVGKMTQVAYGDAAIKANLNLEPSAPRFGDAIHFIEGKRSQGEVPNVSIEVVDVETRGPANPTEAAMFDETVTAATLDGVAILPIGACSDKAGCGIGLCPKATRSGVPVLLHKGLDNKENKDTMPGDCSCGGKAAPDASLQAKVTDLEKALEAKTTEATTLTERVKGYEAAEVQALQEAIQAIAPPGTDTKAIVGESPSVAALTVALNAFKASRKDASADSKVGMGGRKTEGAKADPATAAKANEAHLLALREKYRLPDAKTSKVPAALQRNTVKVLNGVEGPAQA